MKKSKRVLSVLLSVLMLLSVLQTGFIAFAAQNGAALTASEAAIISDPGVKVTCSEVTRVSSGFGKNDTGSVIVPATDSGVPATDTSSSDQISDLENNARAGETPYYPTITIKFDKLPSEIPQIKCTAGGTNVVLSSSSYNSSKKTYSWTVTSGTATAGSCLEFAITYNYNGHEYVNKCYSYVEGVAQPAGVYANTKAQYKKEKWMGISSSSYYAGIAVASRLLGKGVYSSLETYTTSSSILRGYYDASSNSFVSRGGSAYSTFGVSDSSKTTDENDTREFHINNVRSYADVYIDTSVTDSLDDINLRYAVAMLGNNGGNNALINLDAIAAVNGSAPASLSFSGSADYSLGTSASIGAMSAGSQKITRFTGTQFTDYSEYTILTKVSAAASGASNITTFPISVRFHTINKGTLRTLVNNILYNYSPESTKVTNINKGVNPQSWYYKNGFSLYETAMALAQKVICQPNVSQTEIDNAVNSLQSAYQNLVLNEADYTELEAALNAAYEYDEDEALYTTSSYSALQTAASIYNANNNPNGVIEYGYNMLFQAQVDLWTQNILSAIQNLEYKPADYTEVDAAVSAAKALEVNKNLYVDFSKVAATVAAVRYDVKIVDQSIVDSYAVAINEAIAELEYKTADYSQVNYWKAFALDLKSTNYTSTSYNGIRVAIRGIVPNLKITEQARVDGFAVNIQNAIDNLIEKPADYSGLEEAIATANALVMEYYTPDSYANVQKALSNCEGYQNIGITKQTNVDRLKDALNIALGNLVMYDADYSAVLAAIARFEEMDVSQRTAISINAVSAAIGSVVYDLKVNEQSRVDAFAADIENAIDNLDYEGADYTSVNNAIAKAESLDETYYADFSGVTNAIKSIDWTLGVNRQDEVDAMATAINDAISQLLPGPADYTRVYNAIGRFDALNKALYTPNSVAAVEEVINSINWDYTKENQFVVTGYAADITDKILDLVEAEADYTELNRIINTIPSNLRVLYVEDSITNLQSVLNTINWSLKAKDQATVTAYESAVTKAISELIYLPGDYSDVDAAIAEGRAIIAKDYPPISAESAASFESLVASINRDYNIVQVSEIATLASEIRTAYAAFTFDESINNASVSLVTDRTVTYPGNIVNVSVVLGTDYYAASASIPVLYDSNYYTLVGTSVSNAFTFSGEYAAGSVTSGSITSPVKGYPSTFTAEQKAQWKYALITLSPSSNLNSQALILDPAQTVATFQLRVNDDVEIAEGEFESARIYVDSSFLKTDNYKSGKLYLGRFSTSAVDLDVVTSGQSFDLSGADKTLKVVNANSSAVLTELIEAVNRVPAYGEDYYTPDSYSTYNATVEAGQNIIDNADDYKVADQLDVDAVTDSINAAYDALVLKDATTKPLDDALLFAPEYDYTNYTAETYSAYVDAVDAGRAILAEDVITILDNERIAQAAQNIADALDALQLKDFSYYDQLGTALELIPEYEESYYSVESYLAYTNAYNAVDEFSLEDITIINDTEGVNLIFALNQAYNNLYLLDADKADLETAVAIELPYDSSNYTEDTYSVYSEAMIAGAEILNSEERLTIVDNERIAAAATAINDAYAELALKEFSYWDELAAALEIAPEFDDSCYTEETITAFWDAYFALDEYSFNDLKIVDDEEGLALIAALNTAFEALTLNPADMDAYNEAVAMIPEYAVENYTDESYKAFADSIQAATDFNDHYVTYLEQEAVDSLVADIQTAYDALELKPFTYLDELESAILSVPTYQESYYDVNLYADYTEALNAINDMIANAESLKVIDDEAAADAISVYNNALTALEGGLVNADYSAVTEAIAAANALNAENYTNFETVTSAIDAVEYDLLITEQEKVTAFADAINAAIKNLIPSAGNYDVVTTAIENANAKLNEMKASGYEVKAETIEALNAAISAVDYSLSVFDSDEIAAYAVAIDNAAENLDFVPVILINEKSDAEIVEGGFVKGLKNLNCEEDILANFTSVGNNTTIVVVPTDNGYGTGTTVTLFDDDKEIATYTIVVNGDINGDAYVDAFDISILSTIVNEFGDAETEAQKLAVDVCEDGWLDTIDLAIIISMANEG